MKNTMFLMLSAKAYISHPMSMLSTMPKNTTLYELLKQTSAKMVNI